jgi:hypothetical protein
MLNKPCSPGVNITLSDSMVLSMCCWIWFASILRIFTCMFSLQSKRKMEVTDQNIRNYLVDSQWGHAVARKSWAKGSYCCGSLLAEIRVSEADSQEATFTVPTQTQRTCVQRLSPENKGVSPYIPLQTGYRSKKQSSTHICLHVTSLAISFSQCNVTSMFQLFKFCLSAFHSLPLSRRQNTACFFSGLSFFATIQEWVDWGSLPPMAHQAWTETLDIPGTNMRDWGQHVRPPILLFKLFFKFKFYPFSLTLIYILSVRWGWECENNCSEFLLPRQEFKVRFSITLKIIRRNSSSTQVR